VEEEGGGVRSEPGEARTILLLHIITARPSKQPLMVRTFLKVYMELGSHPILFVRTKKKMSSSYQHFHTYENNFILTHVVSYLHHFIPKKMSFIPSSTFSHV
jgi:hypothetical protein